ncbi:YcxB family protein [Flavobacterium daemonense]|uniref:YcxB family protein n=1 Tax=Flavobacterium daemonense TaxID=1393049 RepID=UPI0013A61903|nr:YcxB family protein [Flavobacterium daemonense]KAF2329821.1 YcxB family protein [Flavobacterium daemonense]
MNDTQFSLEFELNATEIRRLNKMYFKNLWEERIRIFASIFLIAAIFLNFFSLEKDGDYIIWIIKNLVLVIIFLLFQYSVVSTICGLIFQLIKKLQKFDLFIKKYKFNFTNSFIYVQSPVGEITHKWSQIEKAILTKDFFFLYVKERNGYIISISNKGDKRRNMNELIAFVEQKVTHITKVC